MAVTTSVFPNLNTFRLGPEFCILFRKLSSTCKTHKRATLSERYPDLCESLEANSKDVCQKETKIQNLDQSMDVIDIIDIPIEDFSSTAEEIVDFNDKLTTLIYR